MFRSREETKICQWAPKEIPTTRCTALLMVGGKLNGTATATDSTAKESSKKGNPKIEY
jgi:hypothetical protein